MLMFAASVERPFYVIFTSYGRHPLAKHLIRRVPPCGIRVAPSKDGALPRMLARRTSMNSLMKPGGSNEARDTATGLGARSRLLRGRRPRADQRTAGAAGPAGRNAAARPGRD